jgi:segregation and condensation protein A
VEFGFAQAAPEVQAETSFVVDVEGFEGPLDLLLDLARRQKVDLHKISVLALAEQYLEFVEAARSLRLELAADYLVMAAWLAYLKSRMLLPQEKKDDEPPAEELAEALQMRLRHLEAIRAAAEMLVNRPRIGRDIFLRGQPEPVIASGATLWRVSLFDLLSAYSQRRQKHALERVVMKQRFVWSLSRARDELEKFTGYSLDWLDLESFIADSGAAPELRRSIRASTLSASLEMVREGSIAMRQDEPFAPLWIKRKAPSGEASAPDNDFGKETSLGGPRQTIS